MHITMGIGALLFGGWVLTAPADLDNLTPAQPLPQQAPQAAAPAPQPGAGTGVGRARLQENVAGGTWNAVSAA